MNLGAAITAHEPAIRLAAFVVVLIGMAVWEVAAPRRTLNVAKRQRWTTNLGIAAINTVILRLLFPVAALGVADLATDRGWGLFNYTDLPQAIVIVASVVALDFAIYLQHVLFHAVPVLWRLHRAHHADLDIDVTTGARFHPIEIVLSLLIKFAAIVTLGAPAAAVVLFEVLLNATAMFSHSNVGMPAAVERVARWFIVTPDMHRVHHSIDRQETDSNFGFNLSLWDRLLGTYRARPAKGHDGMTIGISEFRETAECTTLSGVLRLPFRGQPKRFLHRLDLHHET
jgi:sterol desaturase/sphingolipid hydroxylase (fatty acid hydroxylase superfamily)